MILGRKAMTNLDNILKSRDITLSTKVLLVKAIGFPVVMYGCELDHKVWAQKNWCFWTVVFKSGVPWTARRSNQSILKEIKKKKRKSTLNIPWKDWCWCWSSNPLAIWDKSRLTKKDPDAGKDWRQEEKGMTEEEMVGWHHPLNGHEAEQAQGDGEGQGGLACCSPWGRKE